MRARGHAAFHLVKRRREDNAQGGMRFQGPYTPGQQGRRFRLAAHAQLRVTGPPGGPRPGMRMLPTGCWSTEGVRRALHGSAGPACRSASTGGHTPPQLDHRVVHGTEGGFLPPSLRLFQSPGSEHDQTHHRSPSTSSPDLDHPVVQPGSGAPRPGAQPRERPPAGMRGRPSGRSRGVSAGRGRAGHAVRSGAARPAGRPGLSGGSGGAAGAASGRPARPARAGKAGWPAARSARGP